ncbi:hypothetical protein [uncultured Chryseobacterium sp.]|uniref:hypothetical protein n=1 Tax=uncultured Chryseobacterium sp. TaxID=259322 RepID=UPI0025DC5995|nr:hypothetical protein [uncultured Chryseobacterium sp.]
MKKQLLSIAILAFTATAYGQVGINTTAPATTLDITAKNATGTTTAVDGLMIPRVDRQRAQSMSSVPTSTMIYVNDISTGTPSGTAANIDAVGFYYYNGTAWTKMGSGAGGSAVTANNGLTQASGNIQLGGALTQATTVSGLSATNTMAFTGTGVNAFSVDSSTLSVDAANHRTGFGTTAPLETVQVLGSSKFGRTGTNSIIIDGVSPTPLSTNGLIASSVKNGGILYSEADVNVGILNTQQMNILSGGTDFSSDKILDKVVASFQAAGKAGINTDAPAATVDMNAAQPTGTATAVDGILIPRVDRQRAQSMTSVPVSTLVYVNSISTGTQSGSAVNIDAAGFYYNDGTNWQKLGASSAPAYQNIRGGVVKPTTASYTVQPSDYFVVTSASSGGVTMTFPALTAADAGRTVYVYNYNPSAAANPAASGVITATTANFNYQRGYMAIWTGAEWIIPNK